MSNGTTRKRLKRKFRKKLYHILLALNEIDFSKYRLVYYLLIIAGMLLALSKLPTTETIYSSANEAAAGTRLASAVRTVISAEHGQTPDVVALFLPKEISETDLQLDGEILYSFYLTGAELSYLAEGAAIDLGDSTLYLDGLNYTYHKNRLPFDRVTALSTVSGEKPASGTLYHVVSTEDIFALFHYISYRSIGIIELCPKDNTGTLLSDYQKVLATETGEPLTVGLSLALAADTTTCSTVIPPVVTIQGGFNLVDLIKHPNKITLCVMALFIALVALLWYIIPRLRRIRLWFRIYRIRSKKRSTHTFFRLKKRY